MENIFKSLGRAIGQKNHKAASLNRIRTVIRCEERAAQREYAALGRYYYNSLRDRADPITEPHCVQLDGIEARLESALDKMCQLSQENAIGFIQAPGCPQAELCEEVDLAGIEVYDQDPALEAETVTEEATAPRAAEAAAPQEDCDLPFEG